MQIPVFQSLLGLGEFGLFTLRVLATLRKFFRRFPLILDQIAQVGAGSLFIVIVAAVFLGAVMGYQLYEGFHRFGAESMLGGTIGVSFFRELGPVFTSIMVVGRACASMAAEIGSMKISEQLDALEVMAVDPHEFLVMPRVIAGVVAMPVLAIVFCIVGTVSAVGIVCGVLGLSYATFMEQYLKYVDAIDIIHCVVKASSFGFFVTLVACFYGMRAAGSAKAVGRATQSTVVVGCLTILFVDYILTSLLPFGSPALMM